MPTAPRPSPRAGGYDVVIVGAGPAGATLARLIGGSRKVLLVDRRPASDADSPHAGKCCGGLVAPDAQQWLARQGLGLPREVLTGPQLFVVRTLDMATRRQRYYQRHYINVDRARFERWLVSLVPPSVDVRPGWRFRGIERGPGGLTAVFAGGRDVYRAAAGLLVGADGAASRVRRVAMPGAPAPRAYVAVQEWFEAREPLPYFSALFDPRLTDFYAWTIPKEDHLVVGAALEPTPGANARFERLKASLADFGFRLGPRMHRHGGMLWRPTGAGQIVTGAADVVLVGEAAGWISPSSAEGLSYAFRSAIALADAVLDAPGDVAAAYHARTAALRRNIRGKNLKAPLMYVPWLRNLVMRSGLGAMDVPAGGAGASR